MPVVRGGRRGGGGGGVNHDGPVERPAEGWGEILG